MEKHNWQFQGVWIPADVFDLVDSHDINGNEVLLLSVISGLTKHKQGCYASNKYLAELLNFTERGVQKTLSRLKRYGLIKVIISDGYKRLIFPSWHNVGGGTSTGTGGHVHRDTPLPLHSKGLNNIGDIKNTPDVHEGGSRMFFQSKKKTSKKTPFQFDIDCTNKLHKLVSDQRRAVGLGNWKKVWPDSFRLLRTEVGEERIKKALDWYIINHREPGVPQIDKASNFRKCFIWLEDRMRKGQKGKRDIPISDETKAIVIRLKRKQWPKGSAEQLPQAVEMSLRNFNEFREILKHFEGSPRLERLRSEAINKWRDPIVFVENWFLDIYKNIYQWESWNGELSHQIFNIESKQLRKMGKNLAQSYCSESSRWDELMKSL